MKPDPLESVARDPAGTPWPGRYLPVSAPWAMGDQTIWPMPSLMHSGSTSDSITRHSMLYCGWLETMRSRPIWSAMASAAEISSARHSDTPM